MAQPHPLLAGLRTIITMLLMVLGGSPVYAESLSVLVTESDLQQYNLFVNKRQVINITDFGGPFSNRESVELVMLQQALRLGGYKGDIELVAQNNYSRIIRLIEQGKAQLTSTTIWSVDLDDANNFWVTDPLVRKGEFAVGVYVRPDNVLALNARTLADFSKLTAVSNRNWPVDWATLEAMQVSDIYHINTMALMVKMIGAKRGDFMLAPFSTRDDLSIIEHGVQLVPVPGIKVVLNDSRHWIATKNHPLGEKAFLALQSGLDQLRSTGVIERAYKQSGFFNPLVNDWHVVNAPVPRDVQPVEPPLNPPDPFKTTVTKEVSVEGTPVKATP